MIGINVIGAKHVRAMLAAKDASIRIKMASAITEAGFFIEGEVKESIRGNRAETRSVDTGRFLNSVKPIKVKPFETKVESDVEYAKTLEFGASKRLPRPHFRNTAKRNEKKVRDFVEKKIF